MIRTIARQLGRLIPRRMRREDGTITVEFLICFPAVMVMFLSTFEAGLMMTRYVMIERALDITMREVRLATGKDVTHELVRSAMCQVIGIINNCEADLKVELAPVDTSNWTIEASAADCIERGSTEEVKYKFASGISNQLMFVRACLVVDPFFALSGLGLQLGRAPGGGFRMVAVSAFVYEPDPSALAGAAGSGVGGT